MMISLPTLNAMIDHKISQHADSNLKYNIIFNILNMVINKFWFLQGPYARR